MCDPIVVTLLKMQPHYSHSSRENAAPSSDTTPLASHKGVPPPTPGWTFTRFLDKTTAHRGEALGDNACYVHRGIIYLPL